MLSPFIITYIFLHFSRFRVKENTTKWHTKWYFVDWWIKWIKNLTVMWQKYHRQLPARLQVNLVDWLDPKGTASDLSKFNSRPLWSNHDGRTDGRTDERTNGRTDERTGERTDGRMAGRWTYERTNRRTDVQRWNAVIAQIMPIKYDSCSLLVVALTTTVSLCWPFSKPTSVFTNGNRGLSAAYNVDTVYTHAVVFVKLGLILAYFTYCER